MQTDTQTRPAVTETSALQAPVNAMPVSVVALAVEVESKPAVPSRAAHAGFEAKPKQPAQVDAATVHFVVHGADVTLTGTLHTWSESWSESDPARDARPGITTTAR